MATPANPLDRFVTYTYHFELHAHKDWNVLLELDGSDANAKTTRWSPNGTLLINTRKDAHQVIDNVRYTASCNMTSRTQVLVPYGVCDLVVTEPGGFGFMEKIQALRGMYDIKDFSSLIFVLKPIFVGRYPDNTIQTMYSNLIAGTLYDLSSTVNHIGSIYNMKLAMESSLAATRNGPRGSQMNFAFTDKNMSFEANTVQEAIGLLQTKLQENYDETYTNRLCNHNNARPFKYTILLDSEIGGELDVIFKNSFAPDDKKKLTFDSKKEIGEFIFDILTRSSEVNSMIGASKEAYAKQLHPGAWMPVIIPRVYKKDGEVEIVFDIKVYKGGAEHEFVFDYYFAGAGKNVDIIDYEVAFPTLINWMATDTDFGTDYNVNFGSTLQTYKPEAYVNDVVHEDITRPKIISLKPMKNFIEALEGDIAYLATNPLVERMGLNMLLVKDVPSMRMAYDTFANFRGSVHPQQTMRIRGHKGILDLCTPYPDGSKDMFNTTGGVWVKVNTFMLDDFGQRRQFYYTGYYLLYTVTNVFSGGKFEQLITLTYKDPS